VVKETKMMKYLRENKRQIIISALTGAILGTLVSFLVAAVLLEISDNSFFAIYFGILFLVIGLAIARRVTLSSIWTTGGKLSRFVMALFSLIVLFAGISCFILDHNNLRLSAAQRIPFFLFLGIAVSFAITFALVDVLNAMVASVHTSKQVFLILGSSVLTGGFFGLIFGILDVEDDPSARSALIIDERFSAPVGCVVGAITGVVSHKISMSRSNDYVLATPYVPSNFDDNL
jgi:hypothetical protein